MLCVWYPLILKDAIYTVLVIMLRTQAVPDYGIISR